MICRQEEGEGEGVGGKEGRGKERRGKEGRGKREGKRGKGEGGKEEGGEGEGGEGRRKGEEATEIIWLSHNKIYLIPLKVP